jgi:hypothetical protein
MARRGAYAKSDRCLGGVACLVIGVEIPVGLLFSDVRGLTAVDDRMRPGRLDGFWTASFEWTRTRLLIMAGLSRGKAHGCCRSWWERGGSCF